MEATAMRGRETSLRGPDKGFLPREAVCERSTPGTVAGQAKVGLIVS